MSNSWLSWVKVLGAVVGALLAWSVIGRLLSAPSDLAVGVGLFLAVILGAWVITKLWWWIGSLTRSQ